MNLPIAQEKISREDAVKMIRTARGMVSVYCVKRKDRSLRRFNGFAACNLTDAERAASTTGEGQKFDPKAHDLIPFYEMVSECQDGVRKVEGREVKGKVRRTIGKQFRHVAIEGIQVVRCGGKTFEVV